MPFRALAICAKILKFCEHFLLGKIVIILVLVLNVQLFLMSFANIFKIQNINFWNFTRWLSCYLCIDKFLESWDTIKHFFNDIIVSERTKSGKHLLSVMENVDIKAYFLFLKYVLNFFNSFNAFLQAVKTRIHLLQPKFVNFLIEISKNFIKPELLKHLLINTHIFFEK